MDFAAVLVHAGILLIAVEFCRPGWVWPGVLGGVATVYGASLLPFWPLVGMLASAVFAAAAGGRGWSRWSAVLAVAGAVGATAQLDVHWLTAFSAALPAMALYWLLTVAARALTNKTIVV